MQAWLLAGEFVRRGWDVHYISASETPQPAHVVQGVTLHSLSDDLTEWRGANSALGMLLAKLEPTAVYTRAFDPYTLCGVTAAPESAMTIWAAASRHDGKAWPYLAIGWQYQSLWHFLKRALRHLYYNSMARTARAQAKLVLCQTTEQQQDLQKLGISAHVLRNVHVDVDAAHVQTHEGRPLILWADSIKKLKRPEAFLQLATACRSLEAEFVMIGRIYDSDYQAQIDHTIRSTPNFRYDGAVPLDRVGEFFRRAHLHCKTSLPIEGFPNTYIQAWLHGVPVVALEVDPDRLIRERQLGLVAGHARELESSMRRLISDPTLRKQMGARAREFAQSEFSLSRNVERLIALIDERRQDAVA